MIPQLLKGIDKALVTTEDKLRDVRIWYDKHIGVHALENKIRARFPWVMLAECKLHTESYENVTDFMCIVKLRIYAPESIKYQAYERVSDTIGSWEKSTLAIHYTTVHDMDNRHGTWCRQYEKDRRALAKGIWRYMNQLGFRKAMTFIGSPRWQELDRIFSYGLGRYLEEFDKIADKYWIKDCDDIIIGRKPLPPQ
jgi:hypothetical protein